ncbi:hypothetical protein PYW07_016278 [Mythimna separata]|uniref:Uncharacterized protein n=1 Tax=Mythimna separata TaxID=271217 RepID=A0AAD7YK78_MYTSE|nr:hypothetical protein PYW07_016278 [Mythimna separata]
MKSSLTEIAQNDLKWWLNHLETPSPIHVPHPTHYIVTDASDAWGAYINNTYISGTWKAEEKHLHCNQKEMLAILKTIHHYGQRLHKASLYIQCDSKTAVSYLRNEGGTKSIALMDLAHQILRFVDAYQMHFVIYHIPGVYNVEADRLSRVQRLPEWHLLPQVTNLVFAKWGRPVIDLFASRLAHVVPKYCTLDHQDQEAVFQDAFSQIWDYPLAWIFPPPFLVPKVLTHLNKCRGIFLIVVPKWDQVFWRPDLKNRATDHPRTIRNLYKVLIDTSTNSPPHRVNEMTLEVWRIGGGMKS